MAADIITKSIIIIILNLLASIERIYATFGMYNMYWTEPCSMTELGYVMANTILGLNSLGSNSRMASKMVSDDLKLRYCYRSEQIVLED